MGDDRKGDEEKAIYPPSPPFSPEPRETDPILFALVDKKTPPADDYKSEEEEPSACFSHLRSVGKVLVAGAGFFSDAYDLYGIRSTLLKTNKIFSTDL